VTAISVRGLRKAYDAIEAVRGVDFDIAEGEVFGLLGDVEVHPAYRLD